MSPEHRELIKELQWPVWFVAMSVVMGYLNKSRLRRRTNERPNLMRVPFSILVIGVICSGFFIAAAVLSQIFPGVDGHGVPQKANPIFALLFLGFGSLGIPMIVSYYIERHLIEPGQLIYRTLTKRGVLRWQDVVRIKYSTSLKWFRLETKDGKIVRVSIILIGLPEFAQAVLQQVPASSIDSSTQGILVATAEGHPPSVWV